MSTRSPPVSTAALAAPWQEFVHSRAIESGTADELETSRLRSVIEATVAENEKLWSFIDSMRDNKGIRAAVDKHASGSPVADFFYRARAKARHEQAMGWSRATSTGVGGAVAAPGSWYFLGHGEAHMSDEQLIRSIDEGLLNRGVNPAAYQRLSGADRNVLKVPVRVVHMNSGACKPTTLTREVLVPVAKEVTVEVPRMSESEKEELLRQETEAQCSKLCDDHNCHCHTVPIKEVLKEVRAETYRTGAEVPMHTDRVKVVYVDRPVTQEVIKVVPIEKVVIQEVVREVEKSEHMRIPTQAPYPRSHALGGARSNRTPLSRGAGGGQGSGANRGGAGPRAHRRGGGDKGGARLDERVGRA